MNEISSLILHGHNQTRIWGLSNAERNHRIADTLTSENPIWTDLGFAIDPAWFRHIAAHPGLVVTVAGKPVIAQLRPGDPAPEEASADLFTEARGYAIVRYEDGPKLYNSALRKSETPLIAPLDSSSVRAIERQTYYGAYKGVTDLLTKYLWPELALLLTRLAAKIGVTPNMVTSLGAILCVLATYLFWKGLYWEGVAAGFGFMVLDTVDGKLARCTITSSKLGNFFDHGIDLVHPPFWYWAWGVGLQKVGLALPPAELTIIILLILIGYVVQRLIEGAFLRRFGFHIHIWRRFDSWFRLITARRNPNMILLVGALLLARPDWGLIAVVIWTWLSLVVHAVQLAQAFIARARGQAIEAWLARAG